MLKFIAAGLGILLALGFGWHHPQSKLVQASESNVQPVNIHDVPMLRHLLGQLGGTSPITNFVIIFQENRSPDNLFGDPALQTGCGGLSCLPGFNVTSYGITGRKQVALQPVSLCSISGTCHCHATCSYTYVFDPNHINVSWQHEYNGGRMNGFGTVQILGGSCPNAYKYCAMAYVPYAEDEPYWNVASNYGAADNFFQENQGPSFPAHQYIISGSSACANLCLPAKTGLVQGNPTPPPTQAQYATYKAADNSGNAGGCDSGSTAKVDMIDVFGVNHANLLYPCFDRTTLIDLLVNAGDTAKYYQSGGGAGKWNGPDAIWHLWNNATNYNNLVSTNPANFYTDICTNHTLATVTWITPTGLASDHATDSDGSGPDWVASVLNDIGGTASGCDGRFWNGTSGRTAIFITWDDWGGWYDHVAPFIYNSYEKGFRVPFIVVSPYTPSGYVSHTEYSWGSMFKFIEETLGLGSLNNVDVNNGDLCDNGCLTSNDLININQTPRTWSNLSVRFGQRYFAKVPVDKKAIDF